MVKKIDSITTSGRNLELDALRGIAALMVMFFHFSMNRPECQMGLKFGVAGVNLFFMISGFVIFKSIENLNKSSDFLMNRFGRLFPTYWTAVSFTFVLILLFPFFKTEPVFDAKITDYIGNMSMIQYYLKIQNFDGSYWSMIVELNFYLFIFIFIALKKTKYILDIGVPIAIILTFAFLFKNDYRPLDYIFFYLPITEYFPLFLSGIIFYKISSSENKVKNYIYLGILLFLHIVLLEAHYADNLSFLTLNEHVFMLLLFNLIFFLFITNKLKFIVNKVTLFFGKISFSLYLIHQFLAFYFIIPYTVDTLHLNFWIASIFIAFPIITFLSAVMTFYIEIPLSRRIKRKSIS